MAKTYTFKAAGIVGLVPTDDDGVKYCKDRIGQFVQVKVSQPRSMQQNAMLWAVATMVYDNLPDRWNVNGAPPWPDKHRMVKALQLALGLTDDVLVPGKTGFDIVRTPSSIADMDHDEANRACDLLFRGMARLLGITPDELMNEHARRSA